MTAIAMHFYGMRMEDVLSSSPDDLLELIRCIPYASEWADRFGKIEG